MENDEIYVLFFFLRAGIFMFLLIFWCFLKFSKPRKTKNKHLTKKHKTSLTKIINT